jgi:hypothetical protein
MYKQYTKRNNAATILLNIGKRRKQNISLSVTISIPFLNLADFKDINLFPEENKDLNNPVK